jgi:hypothetical protein
MHFWLAQPPNEYRMLEDEDETLHQEYADYFRGQQRWQRKITK